MGQTGIITPTLQLSCSNLEGLSLPNFPDRMQLDIDDAYNKTVIDQFSALLTASCVSTFYGFSPLANSATIVQGQYATSPVGEFDSQLTRQDRIITEVVAWARTSGSGGVTTVDVQIQQGAQQPANFSSIFASNATRPAVSSSLGNYGQARSSTFVSGTMVWAANTLLKVKLLTAAGDSTQSGSQLVPVVQVYWKPSGSSNFKPNIKAGSITPVLQLSCSNLQALNQAYYAERLQYDVDDAYNKGVIDNLAGLLTASCYSIFGIGFSQASFDQPNIFVGSFKSDVFGIAYTRQDRLIQEVAAWAITSGSGGVTTVDVQIQQGAQQPANFSSIFASNATRPAVSSSLGNYGVSRSSTFVSSSMLWASGTLLLVKVLPNAAGTSQGAAGAQYGLMTQVFWKPSASWGA